MCTVKNFLVVLISIVFFSGNSIYATTDVYGKSPDNCSDLISANEIYTAYEKGLAHSVAAQVQRAIRAGLLSTEDLAIALAHENYDISKANVNSVDVLGEVEKVFGLSVLPELSRQHIGKLVLSNLIEIRAHTSRILNALIRDQVILSGEFTDLVLQETARELNVGELYPGQSHLYLNKKIAEWIHEGNWDKKTDELKRISFFVTHALQLKTQDFEKYYALISPDRDSRPVFDFFMRELVQSLIIDTLELSLIVRQDRPFTTRDSVRVAGTNAVVAGFMVAGTEMFLLGDIPTLAAVAAGGAICGTYLMWRDIYANFKGWLAHRRLALRWQDSACLFRAN
jgi:hypothetical protein